MKCKRGRGEGTIYRRPNGTWCAQVSAPDGTRLTKYAQTQRECREWLAETPGRIRGGFNFDGAWSELGDYLWYWSNIA